ncbi:MAG: bifunctional DNA-formamidopyrimidine glycosylase/DNA-(apurinic or apyrimidinic site) lyase [Candidatus Levybacteria bacterium]|nr:bifunctional DNA-formamidopyrimidine glycosylase/DNA-(apurinic or apyrimidinic site) lyase [Candidatus Levybacteria bacterium]
MPELPEVETIRLGLQKYAIGHKIEDIEIRLPKMFQGDPKDIVGAKVTAARRFGKGLVIDLDNGYSLAIHVKLTGQLIYRDEQTKNIEVSKAKVGTVPNNFTHVVFVLDKNAKLYYNDQRRFGWIKVVPTDKVSELSYFKGIGPEPQLKGMPDVSGVSEVSKGKLTFEKFKARVSISHLKIKPHLMDQKKIGGIGNIYANDALFLAGIDPRRKGHSLSEEELKKLYKAIHTVMEKGFKYGGASELTFVNVLGQEGEYQRHSLVYGKKRKPCPNCGEEIKKIFLGGRGTFFCETCQK